MTDPTSGKWQIPPNGSLASLIDPAGLISVLADNLHSASASPKSPSTVRRRTT